MPHKDPEARRAYKKRYEQEHAEQIREAKRLRFQERYHQDADFRARHRPKISKEAHAAHMRVYKAIKRGELVRPTVCPECGAERFCEAAHLNYTDRLAIRWMCKLCHRKWDRREPKGGSVEPEVRQFHNPVKKLLDFTCPECGKAFSSTYHDSLRNTDTPCCSKSCGMTRSRRQRRERLAAEGIGVYFCVRCGVEFRRAPAKAKDPAKRFCTKSCAVKYRHGS